MAGSGEDASEISDCSGEGASEVGECSGEVASEVSDGSGSILFWVVGLATGNAFFLHDIGGVCLFRHT